MKTKLVLLGILCFCFPFGQSLFAERVNNVRDLDTNCNGIYETGEVNPCVEYQSGPCVAYCPVTRFKPKYYCEKKCIQEPYTVKKKCCRYVPQYFTKQYCRYVPEYYTRTFCRQVPEYYCVNETRYRTRYVTEQKCCYLPYTCVEKRCYECPPSAIASSGCPSSGCPAPGNNSYSSEQYGQPMYYDQRPMDSNEYSMMQDNND